jgi:hypothetical protein
MINQFFSSPRLAKVFLGGLMLTSMPFMTIAQDVMKRPMVFTDFLSKGDANRYYKGSSMTPMISMAELQQSGMDWLVWCAEDNAPIFTDNSARNVVGHLDFKEPLLVLESSLEKTTTGGWVHWLKVRRNDRTDSEGWVRASSLILSPWALKTTGGAGRKVIAVPGFTNGEYDRTFTRRQVFNHQKVRDSDAISGLLVDKFRIFYILRESETAFLLANSPTLEGGNAQQAIIGWMPKEDVSEWNRRLAYGPEYGASLEGQVVPLFATQEQTQDYLLSCGAPDTRGTLEIMKDERIPTVPAYPCIDEENSDPTNGIRKLLLIDGFSMEVDEEILKFIEELRELEEQLGNLNLLFIVDATGSMKKYYSRISDSILRLSSKFKGFTQSDKSSLKVGFGIYKDYADEPNNVRNISPRNFDSQMAGDIKSVDCSSKNPKPEEAVYNGILTNLTKFKIDPKASNVIVIIGDEGNHAIDPKGFNSKQVGDELVRSKSSVFVFQATAFMTESSNRFQKDALDWIHAVAESVDMNLKQLEDGVIGNTFDQTTTSLSEQRHVKLITPKVSGRPASPEEMESLIADDIEGWINSVRKRIDNLSQYRSGSSAKRTPEEKERLIQDAMEKRGVSYEVARKVVDNQGDSAFPVYCPVKSCSDQGSVPLMTPYVFMSKIDFKRIDDSFKRLKARQGLAADKDNLAAMCENLILTQVGTAAQLQSYMTHTLNEIWLEFFQVECNIATLKEIELGEIRRTPDSQFEEAYESMMIAYEEWKIMARQLNKYEWKIARGNTNYYWIPAAFFPGFSS